MWKNFLENWVQILECQEWKQIQRLIGCFSDTHTTFFWQIIHVFWDFNFTRSYKDDFTHFTLIKFGFSAPIFDHSDFRLIWSFHFIILPLYSTNFRWSTSNLLSHVSRFHCPLNSWFHSLFPLPHIFNSFAFPGATLGTTFTDQKTKTNNRIFFAQTKSSSILQGRHDDLPEFFTLGFLPPLE